MERPLAHRLPTTVWPTRYDVDITTSPDRPEFSGVVTMQLDVRGATDRIQMHARDLILDGAQLEVGGTSHQPRIELDKPTETATFRLERPLEAGPATLRVRFAGRPNPGMHGLYLAQDGEERAICTQCEATDARAIFPCFDEPEFKARLGWTIRTEGDVIALANGPLAEVKEENGQKVWRFEATAPVSSYLAALAVGRFEATEATVANGIPIRIWAPRGKMEQARFAHQFTEKLIPWYESYFGIPYPYAKYDQVGVPGFDAGAMENVGLVLFRQNLLLMDPRAASWNQEKLIAKVIAHELAHMWFGNLVTMKWWDDLWLNEAFAEWFAHKATDVQAPSYLVWNDFQADKNRALIDDALPTTHPIYTSVATPSEAIEMFDVITYQKGCAVMRMLENFLGEERFRDGIRTYMAAFAESNAAGADLWRHLAEASGQPVGELMASWIEQPGFPLVTLDVRRRGGMTELHLEQRRFFSSPAAAKEANEQLWNVPMVVRFEDDGGVREHRFIMASRTHVEQLPAVGEVRWVYGNAQEIGFYRIGASQGAVDALLTRGLERLSPVEQMGLLEDQWALVRNASSTIDRFMPVLVAFAGSEDHNVVRVVIERLQTFDQLLRDAGERDARAELRRRVGVMFEGALAQLGWEARSGESQNDLQRRALVIHALAMLARRDETIQTCTRWADRERRDPRAVDANLAGTFVGVAARFGDEAAYEQWIETYKERKSRGAAPQDSLRYLYTLAAFRPEVLTRRTLGYLEDGLIPQEAVGAVIGQLLAGHHSQALAWSHLKTHWQKLRVRVGDMGISRVVEAVGRLAAEHRPDVVRFFEENPPAGAERALARALESMDQREELKARIVPQLTRSLA